MTSRSRATISRSQGLDVELRPAGQLVHPGDELVQRAGDHEVDPVLLERLDRAGCALGQPALGEELQVLAGDVGVLLRAGERELLLDDRLGEHEPRVVVAGGEDLLHRADRVRAGHARHALEPLAGGVEPHRRRAREDPDGVVGPDRVPVVDALDVGPHPVLVDHRRAGVLGDALHPAVDVRGDAADHVVRGRADPLGGPVAAHQLVVVPDAAGGHHDRRRAQLEVTGGVAGGPHATGGVVVGQHGAAHADDRSVLDDQVVDLVAEGEPHQPGGLGALHRLGEDPHHLRPGAPGEVEAGDRVAVAQCAAVAALGPPDEGQRAQAEGAEVVALLAVREVDVRLRPLLRPEVLAATGAVGAVAEAVELRRALPVLPRELGGVGDAHPALLGAVDEQQPAERPPRLPAEVGAVLLVEDQHPPPGQGELVGGDETGEAGADHDDVGGEGVRGAHGCSCG